MSSDSFWTPARQRQAAWALWGGLYLAMALVTLAGNNKTLGPCYRAGTTAWFASRDIYTGDSGAGFLYLPAACLIYAPVAYLPEVPSELLWRIFTIGLFAAGVSRLAALAGRDSGRELFLLTTLVSIPIAWSSARNGQMTLPLAGTMMLAVADVSDRRWWWATLWLSLGLACKPHMIVLSLLVGALYPRQCWRLVLGTFSVLLIPFLAQHPAYVFDQYSQIPAMLRGSFDYAERAGFAHLFSMLEVAGMEIPNQVQMGLRVFAALLTLAACWLAARRNTAAQSGVLLFAYAACYLMLFNPRTENNTYSLVGPALGVCFAQAALVRRNIAEATFLLLLAIGVLGTFELGRLVTSRENAVWLAPLATTCFGVWLAARLTVQSISRASRAPLAVPA